MTIKPLDSLLEKLCSGDPAAAEQVFLAFEPYLRMVVRKKLPATAAGQIRLDGRRAVGLG